MIENKPKISNLLDRFGRFLDELVHNSVTISYPHFLKQLKQNFNSIYFIFFKENKTKRKHVQQLSIR